jgi:TM2 domain-containing membrane protein YozV
MPLTTCPDCNKQVSTEAVVCPGCGRPMKAPSSGGRMTGVQQPTPIVVTAAKSRGVYIILGLLLGLLGIHNFYAGYYRIGAVQLIITLLLGWVYLGIFITGLWVIVDLFTVTEDADGRAMS